MTERPRRLTDQIMQYWNELRGDRDLPYEGDLRSDDLQDVWENCFLLQTVDIEKGHHYNYTYLGKNIEQAYGQDLSVSRLHLIVSPIAETLAPKYHQVLNTREPLVDEDEFINAKLQVVKYRQCLVPFANEDGEVSMILGGMRYKVFED